MIRYPLPPVENKPRSKDKARLEALIEMKTPGWLARAKKRVDNFEKNGEYDEKSAIWSQIKPVYEELQYSKCAFCESELTPEKDGGSIVKDLEHFRPKKGVVAWTSTLDPGLPTGGAMDGYYMLAYAPLNYLLSCKVCNSTHKRNYFPIQGERSQSKSRDPKSYAGERPYLIYPLGEIDDDPERHLEFDGYMIYPRKIDDQVSIRGKVMIELLKLNRSDLLMQRAKQICWFHAYPFTDDKFISRSEMHTACLRAFKQLADDYPDQVEEVLARCKKLIKSKSSGGSIPIEP